MARRTGITFGTRLADIRSTGSKYARHCMDRVAELNRMGFIWDVYEEQWQLIPDSLHVYKKLHGDLEVPYDFVVPSEALRLISGNFKLGNQVGRHPQENYAGRIG